MKITKSQLREIIREELFKIKNSVRESAETKEYGFDLTDVSDVDFKYVLKSVGINPSSVKLNKSKNGWEWNGNKIEVVTSNNPITGKNASGQRGDEMGYAGYIGVTGDEELVNTFVAGIKSKASYIKGSSVGRRYI